MKLLYTSMVSATLLTLNVHAFDLGSMTSMVSSAASAVSNNSSTNSSSSLISMLTSSLGVTPAQATGGATAILTNAASKMSSKDVSSLSSAIPGIASMLGSGEGSSGALGMASSLLGGSSLESQFKALGLDSSMIGKFTPVILNFVKSEAGASLMNSVKSALI